MKQIKEDLFKAQEHISKAIEALQEIEKEQERPKAIPFPTNSIPGINLMWLSAWDIAEKEIPVPYHAEELTNGPITKRLQNILKVTSKNTASPLLLSTNTVEPTDLTRQL